MVRHPRGITGVVNRMFARRPLVVVSGVSGLGRSTVAEELREIGAVHTVWSLHDPAVAAAVAHSPRDFVDMLVPGVAIDDADLAPGLIDTLQAAAAQAARPGQFVVLTGAPSPVSAAAVPTLPLRALTQGECAGRPGSGLAALWNGIDLTHPLDPRWARQQLELVFEGGLPGTWTTLERSRAYQAQVAGALASLARASSGVTSGMLELVFRHVCRHSAAWTSPARIAWHLETEPAAVSAALDALVDGHLLRFVPAWERPAGDATQRRGRWLVADAGMIAADLAMGHAAADVASLDAAARLALVRTMVIGDLLTQNEWRRHPLRFSTWRSGRRSGVTHDIDLVLEGSDGRLLPVVISGDEEIDGAAVDALAIFEARQPSRCDPGVVLHPANRISGLPGGRVGLPLSVLWSAQASTNVDDVGPLHAELREAVSALSLLTSAPRRRPDALAVDRRSAATWLHDTVLPRVLAVVASLRVAGVVCDQLQGPDCHPFLSALVGEAPDGVAEAGSPAAPAIATGGAGVGMSLQVRAPGRRRAAGRPARSGGPPIGANPAWVAVVGLRVDEFGHIAWGAAHLDGDGALLSPVASGVVDDPADLTPALADLAVAHLVSALPQVVQRLAGAAGRPAA